MATLLEEVTLIVDGRCPGCKDTVCTKACKTERIRDAAKQDAQVIAEQKKLEKEDKQP
ncbi:MAG: hypothetical protein WC455_21025 [Dehalococcoidia bacterium]|jgi:hypothetical protein